MRKISSATSKKLQKDQFRVFCDLISKLNKKEQQIFFEHFLSESEKCYLSQRLNVMRMITRNFSYMDIKTKLHVPNATISRSKDILNNNEVFNKVISTYKYKRVESVTKNNFSNEKSNFIKAKYPGAIRID